MMPMPEPLSSEALELIIRVANEQIELIDRIEEALAADDVRKVVELARAICHLEHRDEPRH
jgi:hypothetical protein